MFLLLFPFTPSNFLFGCLFSPNSLLPRLFLLTRSFGSDARLLGGNSRSLLAPSPNCLRCS